MSELISFPSFLRSEPAPVLQHALCFFQEGYLEFFGAPVLIFFEPHNRPFGLFHFPRLRAPPPIKTESPQACHTNR